MFGGIPAWRNSCAVSGHQFFSKGASLLNVLQPPFRENREKQVDPKSMCKDCPVTKISYNSLDISVFGQKALEAIKFERGNFF